MRKASLPTVPFDKGAAIAVAIIAGVGLLAFAAWLAYGGAFYMSLIDGIIAWCT